MTGPPLDPAQGTTEVEPAGTPLLTSPHGTGALRYMGVALVGDEVLYYYEYARADRAHEIRMSRCPATPIAT